jgi:hypothetical protein
MLGNTSQHARAYLGASVKRKNIVRPSGTLQHSVGATSLSLDRPANLEQSLENFAGFSGTPCTHALMPSQ